MTWMNDAPRKLYAVINHDSGLVLTFERMRNRDNYIKHFKLSGNKDILTKMTYIQEVKNARVD
jgi:hypothetical protein